jgi:hypothetical protein
VSSYRDPLAVALAELAERQKRVAELCASVRPAQRAVLGEDERALLDRAPLAIGASPANQDELTRVNLELDAIVRLVSHANAALVVDSTTSVAPSTAPTNKIVALFLTHVVAPFGGSVTQEGTRLVARAAVQGVDLELEADIGLSERLSARSGSFVLGSRAPQAFPAVEITPQGRARSFAKMLHLASEHEVGVAAFDDAYWVRGDREAVRAVLGADVVRILTMLAPHAPTLEIADGRVRLAWTAPAGDALDEAVWSRTEDRIEAVVPRAAFALHVAIRRALAPIAPAAPPPCARPPEPPPPPPPRSPRLEDLRVLFREYGYAIGRDQQRPYGVPSDADDFEPKIQALGTSDLLLLDELASAGDEDVVPWARGRAEEIRTKVVRERVEKMAVGEVSALAEEFLADDAERRLRVIVVELLRDRRDTAWVAELLAQMIARENGQRFARAMADDKVYNRVAIHRAVSALVHEGRSDVVTSLFALPSPTSIDAALAVAWLVPTSPTADALERTLHGMSAERRREIVLRFVGASPHVDTEVLRRFFDDPDADVRRFAIGDLLHRGDLADFAAVVRALRSDVDARVRQSAARALEAVGKHASVRDGALSTLRDVYTSDPHVRKEAMTSIMNLRRDTADKTLDPRKEFERAFAAYVAAPTSGWSAALEDAACFGHDMMSTDRAVGQPILAAALADPRAAELRQHLAFRL